MADLTTFRGVLHPSPRAEALREYADRWHGRVEPGDRADLEIRLPPGGWSEANVEALKAAFEAASHVGRVSRVRWIPADPVVTLVPVCRCGASVGEDGCPERRQLLADAYAIEQGRDFQEVA